MRLIQRARSRLETGTWGLLLPVFLLAGTPAEGPAPGGHSALSMARATAEADIVVPAGTEFEIRTTERLGTDTHRAGDRFTATIVAPLTQDRWVAVPAGARVTGVVTAAGKQMVNGKRRKVLVLEPREVQVDGRTLRLVAEVTGIQLEKQSNRGTLGDAAIVGGGAAAGGLLGGLISDERGGTLIGAIVGGAAGTAAMIATKGSEAVLPRGSLVTVRLEEPLRVPGRGAGR